MSNSVPPATLKALAGIDTCTVTNAIECFDVRLRNEGFIDSSIRCRLPALPPMVGYAVTLRVRSAAPSWKGENYLDRNDWWSHLQQQPAPHVLVIQDMDHRPGIGAYIGEVHSAILQALGAVGVITNGAVRDLPGIEALGFQAFSGSVAVSHAYIHIVEIGGSVDVGGLRIAPGDLLHGDQHGVVRIPLDVAERIPATAARIRDREQKIVDYCRSADFTVEKLRQLAGGDPCAPVDGPDQTSGH